MRLLRLLPALCLFAGFALPAVAAENKAAPPNIMLIVADDLGWADLGSYGNKFNETPRLDHLAKEGLRYTNFYAAGAVCSPTRASILSGQYQARFGLTAHIPGHWKPFERVAEPPPALEMPLNIVTLAETLRKHAGYQTAYFGKWHLGGAGFGPKEQGFDTAWEFTGHTVPIARQQPRGEMPRRAAEYLAVKTIEFLEQRPRDEPFFVQVSYYAVHIPLDTTPALRKKYEEKPRVEGYSCHPLYAGLLEEMDSSVGRILDALERLKLRDDTLVVFTSDNGGLEREVGGWPGTLNRPLRNEKGSLYEGGIRVPTIVRWPAQIKPGTIRDAPAISVDFYPTLLAAAADARDKDQLLDGSDLELAAERPAETERALYWHYPHYHHSRPSGALRRGDWKLIEFFDTGETELYNLREDISESRNLAAQEAERASELLSQLRAWRRAVNAQMPQRNPAFDPRRKDEWWSRGKVEPTEAPGTLKP